ncbi:uncharacterized protein METZ01_LOCUS402103, partial [marine metagenome]
MAFSEVQSNSKPNSTAKSSSDKHISTKSTESIVPSSPIKGVFLLIIDFLSSETFCTSLKTLSSTF